MYHSMKTNAIRSKYFDSSILYDLRAIPGCVRIAPYRGGGVFNELRYPSDTSGPRGLFLSKPVRKEFGPCEKAFLLQEDDVFYLIGEDFCGDPRDADFPCKTKYLVMPEPDNNFFREADTVAVSDMQTIHAGCRGRFSLPKKLMSKLNANPGELLRVTPYSVRGREWIEVAPMPSAMLAGSSSSPAACIAPPYFPAELSGVSGIIPNPAKFDLAPYRLKGWSADSLAAWYSENRNAIILENAPVPCAVCGELIRSLAPEHFTAQACEDCLPDLGKGKAIEALTTAIQALDDVDNIAC